MKRTTGYLKRRKISQPTEIGHFYDDYLGKNTFRKEVVLGFSKLRKGGLHFSEAPLPHSPWMQSLETIFSYWWVQRAGQRSSAGREVTGTDGPKSKISEQVDYLLQGAVWGGHLEGWRHRDTGWTSAETPWNPADWCSSQLASSLNWLSNYITT